MYIQACTDSNQSLESGVSNPGRLCESGCTRSVVSRKIVGNHISQGQELIRSKMSEVMASHFPQFRSWRDAKLKNNFPPTHAIQ